MADPRPRAYIEAMDETLDTALKGPPRIQAYLKNLPDQAGVYRMLDDKGNVLYVGKARSLKKRVTQYAQGRFHTCLLYTSRCV